MAKRKLLKDQYRRKLVDIPVDEDSLFRHYSLSRADRLEIELRRRNHNRLGFAIQLCLMRYPGRVLGAEEILPRAMLKYVADQIGAAPEAFSLYARREETCRDHTARLMMYLDTRSATLQDRRAALLSAIQAAATSDDGAAIVSSIVAAFRERSALLPAIDTIERIGLAGRAIARRRAETTLIKGVPLDTLRSLDPAVRSGPVDRPDALPLATLGARSARCVESGRADRPDSLSAAAGDRSDVTGAHISRTVGPDDPGG